jgi:hypothetical protein
VASLVKQPVPAKWSCCVCYTALPGPGYSPAAAKLASGSGGGAGAGAGG